MELPDELPFALLPIDDYPQTAFGWPVVPDGLRALLGTFRNRYGDRLPPLMITENGCSTDDRPDTAGKVNDQDRIDYLDGHLTAVRESIADGVDVRGYFVWSLIDNFEWAEGYSQRFGLVRLDPGTGDRTPKASYGWLRDHIRAARG